MSSGKTALLIIAAHLLILHYWAMHLCIDSIRDTFFIKKMLIWINNVSYKSCNVIKQGPSAISQVTHICPAKSRGAPRPEGSPPDLHSAGLYDSGTDDNTKTYLEEMTRRNRQQGVRDRFMRFMKQTEAGKRHHMGMDLHEQSAGEKISVAERICDKKKKTALRKIHRWAMMLSMREGSWLGNNTDCWSCFFCFNHFNSSIHAQVKTTRKYSGFFYSHLKEEFSILTWWN